MKIFVSIILHPRFGGDCHLIMGESTRRTEGLLMLSEFGDFRRGSGSATAAAAAAPMVAVCQQRKESLATRPLQFVRASAYVAPSTATERVLAVLNRMAASFL
jgi:hypothetical protein